MKDTTTPFGIDAMTERDRRISDQLVRLVQIVFGLVLAQGLLLHREIVLHPFAQRHWIATMALATVYFTAVLSWIDWHVTMESRPYNFNPRNRYRVTEQMRLGIDIVVVVIYAYLTFSIQEFSSGADAWIGAYLVGYPAVFLAYLISGAARRRAHGALASNPGSIVAFGSLYAALSASYWLVYQAARDQSFKLSLINCVALLCAFALMLGYRAVRRRQGRMRSSEKTAGLVIGIDVDGVLANQIYGVLPRVRARLGIDLTYDDVVDWRLPLGNSDIAKEINVALEDPEYVLRMPVHDGARDLVDALYPANRIVMLTARPPEARNWTSQWLHNNGFAFDELINAREAKKSFYRTDILVDDYIGNVKEYLENSTGAAILVQQPWNKNGRDLLENWIDDGRLHIVERLHEAIPILNRRRELVVRQRNGAPIRTV